MRETDEENRKELASRVQDQMVVIVNNDNATRNDVVSAIADAIQGLGNNVTTSTIQVTKVNKDYKKRPMEWRDIAIHFQQNIGIDKTLAAYKLLESWSC